MSSISTLSGDGVVILLITIDGEGVELSGFTLMMVGTDVVLLGVIVGVEVILLANENGAVVAFDPKLGDKVTLLIVSVGTGDSVEFESNGGIVVLFGVIVGVEVMLLAKEDGAVVAFDAKLGDKVTLLVMLSADGAEVVLPSDVIDGARDDSIGAGDGTSGLFTPNSKSSETQVRSAKVIVPAAPSSR